MIARSKPMRRSRPKPIPLAVRAQVIERQDHKCLRCGEVKTLQMHHKLRKSQGGTDADCVGLCLDCHDAVHANPAQAARDGFLILRKVEAHPEMSRRLIREWEGAS